ncbi:hypothetical protein [Bacteroides faecalis]|uniref:Uncharacterized protein n=1 Tax=Bacteroides faecalis TaxID=2447885 RepID=A0A401LZB7_9BACE|nr:hypothetical protein [Bacteroides faecalis]GCB36858.1 hypothetical protein KGMB02408_38030 [Bacteroides faecalis]
MSMEDNRVLFSVIMLSFEFPEIKKGTKATLSDITARPEYNILNKQVAIAE